MDQITRQKSPLPRNILSSSDFCIACYRNNSTPLVPIFCICHFPINQFVTPTISNQFVTPTIRRLQPRWPPLGGSKEERFLWLTFSEFIPLSAGSKAKWHDVRAWQRRAAHFMAAGKQRGKQKEAEKQIQYPKSCTYDPPRDTQKFALQTPQWLPNPMKLNNWANHHTYNLMLLPARYDRYYYPHFTEEKLRQREIKQMAMIT